MSTDLFRLVYCSRNAIPVETGDPAAEVAAILAASRVNNARDGISGALLYSNGCFAQALEGRLDAVQRTFERIQRDLRHRDVIMLEAGYADERLFGAWEMALAETSDPTKAGTVLGGALANPDGHAGKTVVELLSGLVHREGEWLHAAE